MKARRTDRLEADRKAAIRVAAKTGFLSKRIWREFLSHGHPRWKNRQWKSLIDVGIFEPVTDYGFTRDTLKLADLGKKLANAQGLDAVTQPTVKNLWHDEELVKLALCMEREGWLSSWKTETELKVQGSGNESARASHREKYSDLIIAWNTPGRRTLWAVELERSVKEFTRYYDMVGSYQGISIIDAVLVIVETPAIEANIRKAQAKLNYPQDARPMLFATLAEMSTQFKSCELRIGAARTTFSEMANALLAQGAPEGAIVGKCSEPGVGPRWA